MEIQKQQKEMGAVGRGFESRRRSIFFGDLQGDWSTVRSNGQPEVWRTSRRRKEAGHAATSHHRPVCGKQGSARSDSPHTSSAHDARDDGA